MLLKFYLTKFTYGELGSSLCKRWNPQIASKFLLLSFRFTVCGPFAAQGDKGEEEYP
jgi:hypothetical protein